MVDRSMKIIATIVSVILLTGIIVMGSADSTQECPPGQVELTFRYVPDENEKITSVSLRGSFNNWDEWPMELQSDTTWSISVCVEPGEHLYKFYINGQWPSNMETAHNGNPVDLEAEGYVGDGFGGQNAVRIIAPQMCFVHDPDDPAYLCESDGRLVIRLKTPPNQIVSVSLIADGENLMEKQLWWDYGEIWRVSLPSSGPIEYKFELKGFDGQIITFPEETFVFDGNYQFEEVSWVGDGVIYQIFPDRFYNGDPGNDKLALGTDEYVFNKFWTDEVLWEGKEPFLSSWKDPISSLHCCHQYFGGDLQGITEKMVYLEDLGVTAIYLNPIFDSGSAHGYDTHDYMKVSPKFGTEEDLKLMLDTAHDSGIRVIFDLVPNHTGLGFPQFQDVVENGEKSEYWDWYFINEYPFIPGDPSGYECWWGVGSLPKLNAANQEVKDYLFGVVDHWLEFGFDGCRVDVPNEVIDAHNFFAEMRDIVKEKHPDAYLVGEIWGLDGSWVQGDQFDSLMNYALGKEALLPYANGSASGEKTFNKLAKYFATYGENVAGMGFNLVSSHDTGRVLTDLGGGNFNDGISKIAIMRLKLLSTLLYSLPGAPVTFQGDERGILGEKELYDAHRYPIQWDFASKDLLAHYKNLAEMRGEIPALTSNAIFQYMANNDLISFFRGEEKDVLVVANNGLSSVEFDLPDGCWKVAGSGEMLENTTRIPPLRAVVLERV